MTTSAPADYPPTRPAAAPPGHFVTAVLVVHDGARWLPETIAALAEQTRVPDLIRVVDTGSTDASRQILADAVGADQVINMPAHTGFGAAVAAALGKPQAVHRGRRAVREDTASTRWIWLLHDDAAPAPDALERLLAAADGYAGRRSGGPGILGCKHRDWYDRKVLLDVGLTTDIGGRRETGVDRGEHDQGQYDDNREVLAVDSAGMLVRREVWDHLRGFDPMLPLYRDDIDFCWRAARAGVRTAVVTDAVVYHAEAASRHRRTVHATASHARLADRRHGMYTLAANLPLHLAAFALVRNVVTSAFRAVGWVLAKQLGYALDELSAVILVLARPDRVMTARGARRRLKRPWRQIRHLMPPRGAALRRVGERISAFSAGAAADSGRHSTATEVGEEDEDAYADTTPGILRRALSHPGFLLVVGLCLVAVVAERHVLGLNIAGGALLPAPDSAASLWRSYLETWHPVGLGGTTTAPPYLGVFAALATIFGGKPAIAVDVLLLGCVPLAGWAAYLAAGRLGRDRAVRVWVAAAYALLPVATGAIAAGRLGTAVAFVVLPLIAYFAAKVLAPSSRGALRPAFACGLLLSLGTAFAPVLWPTAFVLAVVAGLFLWRRRAVLSGLVVTILAPLAVLYPWSFTVLGHPGLLLLDTGYHPAYLAAPRLHPVALLLLHPGGPGQYPVWMCAGLVVAALAALFRRGSSRAALAGWAVAFVGLVIGLVLSRINITEPESTFGAVVWPGVAVAVVGVGLLVAIGSAAQDAPERLLRFGFGWRQVALIGLVVVAGAAPLLAGAWWVVNGAGGPLHVVHGQVVPEYLTAQSDVPSRPRTLIVKSLRGRVEYTVVRGRAPTLGDELLQPPKATRERLDAVVGDLVSGRASDVTSRLQPFGIRYVLVAGPVDQRLAQRLDGEDGLVRQSATHDFALWQTADQSSRLEVVDTDGTAAALPAAGDVETGVSVEPGGSGRLLVLTDAAADGWRATIGGRELQPRKVDGWAQAFVLPASGGRVELSFNGTARHGQLIAEGVLVLLLLVLALPGARREDYEPAPEQARREGEGGVAGRQLQLPKSALGLADTGPQPVPAGEPYLAEQNRGYPDSQAPVYDQGPARPGDDQPRPVDEQPYRYQPSYPQQSYEPAPYREPAEPEQYSYPRRHGAPAADHRPWQDRR
ncbi:MAG: glycosyltransferase [Streptosporangiales bacterium]|nr:glycosyltransferase [Streptosporangiales bacterium]